MLAALLLSAGVHAVVVSGGWFKLPRDKDDPSPLLVRLEPAPPAAPPAAQKPPAPVAKLPAKPRIVAPRLAAAPPTVKTDVPLPWIPSTPDPASSADVPETAAQVEGPEAAPALEPIVVANAAPSTFAPEPEIIKTLPRRGRIAYAMNYYMSDMPTLIGRTVQTWEATNTTYKLDSLSETVGLARFTRFGPRTYSSSGMVTERGLQPLSFTSKVVISGKSDDTAAQFDWSKNALQFGRASDQKSAPLPTGSQDLLSFVYQLSLAPPPRGRLQMPITNGSRFENYEIEVFAEEIIETPLGQLRTLPVKQARRPGRETIEVWLAAEYQYLPVRIRVINRDGTTGGEQIATEISIGEK